MGMGIGSGEIKGKNFSGVNRGQRKASDFYETPYSITRQFLDQGSFANCKSILEPACGNGAIISVLAEYFSESNISSYDLSMGNSYNFLNETRKIDCIITNPPFSLAYEFILKAKEIATQKFAMLLPLSYLHGEKRYKEIYSDLQYPLSTIYVYTRYPMLGDPLRSDGKYRTGMMVYAWFVWDKYRKHPEPTIRWISNQQYILNKADRKGEE